MQLRPIKMNSGFNIKQVIIYGLMDSALPKERNGKPIYMVGTHVDITPLKKQQEVLEEQKNEFDRLINNLGEAVFRLNSYNQITFMNNYWHELSGFDVQGCLMEPITTFLKNQSLIIFTNK